MNGGARPHLVLVDEPLVLSGEVASWAEVEALARLVERRWCAVLVEAFEAFARDVGPVVEQLAALVPEEGPAEVEAPMLRALAVKRARSAPPSAARLHGRRR